MFAYSVFDTHLLAPLALLLDLALGDPPLPWPHPVVFLGRTLNRLEVWARLLAKKLPLPYAIALRLTGAMALLLLAALSAALVGFFISLPLLGPILALYFSWAGLAMGSLLSTGSFVLSRIEEAPLLSARRALSQLVSRDTSRMDRQTLRKTLADTMTENFTDALTAPFFWLLIAGPAGLWIYKAVSTVDSMWGYKTERWRFIGFAGARADDLLALLPARLSLLVIGASHFLVGFFAPKRRLLHGPWPGLLALHREALGMPSPNSGCPMAAFAWLCQARMAGPSVYFGELVDKPWLGPPSSLARPWNRHLLTELFHSMQLYGCLGMFLIYAALLLLDACFA